MEMGTLALEKQKGIKEFFRLECNLHGFKFQSYFTSTSHKCDLKSNFLLQIEEHSPLKCGKLC